MNIIYQKDLEDEISVNDPQGSLPLYSEIEFSEIIPDLDLFPSNEPLTALESEPLPIRQVASQPIHQAANQPTHQIANIPTHQVTSQPMLETINQPTGQAKILNVIPDRILKDFQILNKKFRRTKSLTFHQQTKKKITPVNVLCPSCNQRVLTTIKTKFGAKTFLAAVGVGIVCWPLAWVPLVIKPLKNKKHVCPSCGINLGKSVIAQTQTL
ncbi:hypothetical protein BB559_003258 [Furculomyces boomerangus]|uniref:LITAF domain-containing protein n=1 Tax=Furculomyces boomerangus TaxID=61424 RepID=A0A2T9YMA1_9FUNG|nr:hypothetical protein BB559_003258 [Furculomyces boomerangus]